jgi:cytochrome c556
MKAGIIAVCVLTLSIASATVAHDGASGAVKVRMDAMEAVGDALKRLNLRTRSQQVSAEQAQQAVAIIRNVAVNTPKLFEEKDTSHPSEAKPEIWTNWNDFVARSKQLAAATDKLERTVDDQVALQAAIREVGEICSGCHRRYRE